MQQGAGSMSGDKQARSQQMSQRQGSLSERATELAKKAKERGGRVPGLEKSEDELKKIGEDMQQAGDQMKEGAMKEGGNRAREIAERIARLRDSMGQKGQSSGRGNRREPVRIPGAGENQAPREWREELMEAMREKAIDRYSEETRRYYRELVK